jgi:hypothetical protein
MSKINFEIVFETKIKRHLDSYLSSYAREVNQELVDLRIDSGYQNDTFQASFHIMLGDLEKEALIYEALIFANKLEFTGGRKWSFHGPVQMQELIFELYLDNTDDDQPLKTAIMKLES